jgi:hypothetical protein
LIKAHVKEANVKFIQKKKANIKNIFVVCAFLLLNVEFLILLNGEFLYYNTLSCALRVL